MKNYLNPNKLLSGTCRKRGSTKRHTMPLRGWIVRACSLFG